MRTPALSSAPACMGSWDILIIRVPAKDKKNKTRVKWNLASSFVFIILIDLKPVNATRKHN